MIIIEFQEVIILSSVPGWSRLFRTSSSFSDERFNSSFTSSSVLLNLNDSDTLKVGDSLNNFYHQDVRTGRCLVFITPASERTMGTYLGASERLVFDESFVTHANNSKILFSEGYQFTSDENFEAFFRVLSEMNKEVKFALSLSDPGVVQGFRDRFEKVIASRKIDYL